VAETAAETEKEKAENFFGRKTEGQSRAETLAEGKYNPALQGKPKTAEEVQAAGGLGAIAARRKTERDEEARKAGQKAGLSVVK
jgi:hypothetical protein